MLIPKLLFTHTGIQSILNSTLKITTLRLTLTTSILRMTLDASKRQLTILLIFLVKRDEPSNKRSTSEISATAR